MAFNVKHIGWAYYKRMPIHTKQKDLRLATALSLVSGSLLIPIIAVNDYKWAIAWFCFCLSASALALYKRAVGQELIIAFMFALFVTSYHLYVYEDGNFYIGHINLYPLIAWTAGLVLLREVYEKLQNRHRWLLASGLYLALLFAVECIGYYVLEIRLDGNLPSLLGLGIIHGTPFLHAFYVLAGPIYLLITDYLEVR